VSEEDLARSSDEEMVPGRSLEEENSLLELTNDIVGGDSPLNLVVT